MRKTSILKSLEIEHKNKTTTTEQFDSEIPPPSLLFIQLLTAQDTKQEKENSKIEAERSPID